MSPKLETLLLYYMCWHDGEFTFAEMCDELLLELDETGLLEAVALFREERLKRFEAGDRRTYYQYCLGRPVVSA